MALALAELDARNPRDASAAAVRAVAASRRERSFKLLFSASNRAGWCISKGALGPTYRWSQLAPFLENMEEALPHLQRWAPQVQLERWMEDCMAPFRVRRRRLAHSDRYEHRVPMCA